jgi:hypothetical protein
MNFAGFINSNKSTIKLIAEQLKDFKIKGIPIRYETAYNNIVKWIENFNLIGFPDYKLPLQLLRSIEFVKTEALIQKIADMVAPYMGEPDVYLAPLGEASESSFRIVSNFNQYENYFPNIGSLLNNIPDGVSPKIILIDDFLNSGGQLINIFYALINKPLPNGEPNDEIEFRTQLNDQQIGKLKRSKITLLYYLAFDEGIEKILQRCQNELSLNIEVKRYLATNKNESAFGDPIEQENIDRGFRGHVSSSSSAFINYRTESLTTFYHTLMRVGKELNEANKSGWDSEKIKNRTLGYGNLGRLIITDYNIPTISITALWQSGEIVHKGKKISWNSLLPRREKKLSSSIEQKNQLSIKQEDENIAYDIKDEIEEQISTTVLESSNEEILLEQSEEIENDDRDLKGYTELYQILTLFRPNSKFIELGRQESKKNKIGYIICQENDEVYRRVNYYIYLFQGSNLTATYEDIKKNHTQIIQSSKNLIILLPKEKKQIQIEKRIETIKNKFSPLSVYYVDDFIRNNCTHPNYFQKTQSKFLETKNFIPPTIKSEFYSEVNLETVQTWIISDHEPILVVKGVGGIGKTTLTEYISDLFINKNLNSKVIFIDTHDLIEELLKREKFNQDIDIYNIYEADVDIDKTKEYKLTREQFRLNLDIGNLLVVIDGLDEVISRISKFDIDKFLDSIFKFTNDSGNGKVLISCRSHFWQISKYTPSQMISIEILPFNLIQAKLFFEKSFSKDLTKVRKAFDIANRLSSSNGDNEKVYHPYVLDIIKNLIETEKDIQEGALSLESKLLEKSVKYDLIIYEVCYRESNRIIKGINIDQQVKFFMELAVDHKGSIPIAEFTGLVQASTKTHIDTPNIEAFKSHPFLQLHNNNIKFRYDFFTQYCKSIYISNYIKYESEYEMVDNDFINILVEDCWYNSGTITDMKARIKTWNEDDDLKIIDLISQLRLKQDLEKNIIRKAICHLFYISLAIYHKQGFNDITSNTNLLKLLFQSESKVIEEFFIINFYSKKDNIRFDFRGLVFKNCYIDNFESFWLCPADNTTFFRNSTLINLNFSEIIRSSIPRANFQDCIFNEEIDDFYRQKQILQGDNLNLQIRYELQYFFKLFLNRGKIERQALENYIVPQLKNNKTSLFEPEDFIKALVEGKAIIVFDEFGELQTKVTDEYREDIKSFIRNGMMSQRMGTLVVHLKKNLKSSSV